MCLWRQGGRCEFISVILRVLKRNNGVFPGVFSRRHCGR